MTTALTVPNIDVNQAWAFWPDPEITKSKLSETHVVPMNYGPSQRLAIQNGEGTIGYLSAGGLREMSLYASYPSEFVEKLPLELQAMVITERLSQTKSSEVSFTGEPFDIVEAGGERRPSDVKLITNVSPGWRDIVNHATVAQTAWNLMMDVYGGGLEVKVADRQDNVMRLRVLSPQQEPVTRQVGDILRLGVDIKHQYGCELTASLFTERLVCLNGMTSSNIRFNWKMGLQGSMEDQLGFISLAVMNAINGFDPLVQRAKDMAEIHIGGDAEEVLIERARAMRLPKRHHVGLIEAFREEPMPTEWGFLNAFTRLASHGEHVTPIVSRQIMDSAGDWVNGFDMVNARMPRPMAVAVGAHILEEVIDAAE